MHTWRILARHKWVPGCTITESVNSFDGSIRRFTATIRGWRNWKIYEGDVRKVDTMSIQQRVLEIRNRIDANDESIFYENMTLTA